MPDERIAVSVTKPDRVDPVAEAFDRVERDAEEGNDKRMTQHKNRIRIST